ncbi:hypothetical protein EVAR_86191_1 [Eumeta japonica]|uniref:Uncharacterized protein n=1 Tax=Eumeta variegata TaxID=151549 RepID=A0A4C1UCZ7_EUMVA|nr:hypothetical protein EVAR_86191_1 [Eumeta japonica]
MAPQHVFMYVTYFANARPDEMSSCAATNRYDYACFPHQLSWAVELHAGLLQFFGQVPYVVSTSRVISAGAARARPPQREYVDLPVLFPCSIVCGKNKKSSPPPSRQSSCRSEQNVEPHRFQPVTVDQATANTVISPALAAAGRVGSSTRRPVGRFNSCSDRKVDVVRLWVWITKTFDWHRLKRLFGDRPPGSAHSSRTGGSRIMTSWDGNGRAVGTPLSNRKVTLYPLNSENERIGRTSARRARQARGHDVDERWGLRLPSGLVRSARNLAPRSGIKRSYTDDNDDDNNVIKTIAKCNPFREHSAVVHLHFVRIDRAKTGKGAGMHTLTAVVRLCRSALVSRGRRRRALFGHGDSTRRTDDADRPNEQMTRSYRVLKLVNGKTCLLKKCEHLPCRRSRGRTDASDSLRIASDGCAIDTIVSDIVHLKKFLRLWWATTYELRKRNVVTQQHWHISGTRERAARPFSCCAYIARSAGRAPEPGAPRRRVSHALEGKTINRCQRADEGPASGVRVAGHCSIETATLQSQKKYMGGRVLTKAVIDVVRASAYLGGRRDRHAKAHDSIQLRTSTQRKEKQSIVHNNCCPSISHLLEAIKNGTANVLILYIIILSSQWKCFRAHLDGRRRRGRRKTQYVQCSGLTSGKIDRTRATAAGRRRPPGRPPPTARIDCGAVNCPRIERECSFNEERSGDRHRKYERANLDVTRHPLRASTSPRPLSRVQQHPRSFPILARDLRRISCATFTILLLAKGRTIIGRLYTPVAPNPDQNLPPLLQLRSLWCIETWYFQPSRLAEGRANNHDNCLVLYCIPNTLNTSKTVRVKRQGRVVQKQYHRLQWRKKPRRRVLRRAPRPAPASLARTGSSIGAEAESRARGARAGAGRTSHVIPSATATFFSYHHNPPLYNHDSRELSSRTEMHSTGFKPRRRPRITNGPGELCERRQIDVTRLTETVGSGGPRFLSVCASVTHPGPSGVLARALCRGTADEHRAYEALLNKTISFATPPARCAVRVRPAVTVGVVVSPFACGFARRHRMNFLAFHIHRPRCPS